ncbi:MAG: response regulator transcription factor [Chlamydiales bacterium]
MVTLQEMQRNTIRLCHDKLKNFCEPINCCFGVNHFYHGRLNHSGQYVNIGLATYWEEAFYSSSFAFKWPTFNDPENLKTGMVLLKIFDDEPTKALLVMAKSQFNINHVFELIYQTNEGIDIFGFGLKSSNPIHQIALIKEIPLLRLFIKRYQEEFKSHINASRDYEVDISGLIGATFYKTSKTDENDRRNRFLKIMGISTLAQLSNREREVAKCLTKGYTAPQISKELFISTRTVEHHLQRIKDKLGCSSKSDLIQKVLELEMLGYFS